MSMLFEVAPLQERSTVCRPGRASAILRLAPGAHDCGWICSGNFVGPDRAGLVMKSKIRSLAGVVCDSRRPSVSSRDISLGYRCSDTAEIVAINQVGIRIFAESKHQL